MKYNKPVVAVLGLAFSAVRGSKKEPTNIVDSERLQLTTGAYEADE